MRVVYQAILACCLVHGDVINKTEKSQKEQKHSERGRTVLWSEISAECHSSSECVIPAGDTWILDQRNCLQPSTANSRYDI